MRVEQFLTDSAKRFGDKIALVAGAKRLSFGELDAMSDRLACVLARQGVQRGDRVLHVAVRGFEALGSLRGAVWRDVESRAARPHEASAETAAAEERSHVQQVAPETSAVGRRREVRDEEESGGREEKQSKGSRTRR